VGVVERQRGKVGADVLAFPPAVFERIGEVILVEQGTNIVRRGIGEGVRGQQAEHGFVVLQQLGDEVHNPRVILVGAHRCEPHLPVEFPVVRRNDARTTLRVAGFALELVRARRLTVVAPFDDDFVTVPAHAAERAVGVDEMERLETGIHHLTRGDEIERRLDAEQAHQRQ